MSSLFTRLQEEQEKQQQLVEQKADGSNGEKQPSEDRKPTQKTAQKNTRGRGKRRDRSSDTPRNKSREAPRDLPTRDEIQVFSFRLRDELKVKVQAEVPHQWQRELEEIARGLNVKKLELYRFILGEFLGKVKRSRGEGQK